MTNLVHFVNSESSVCTVQLYSWRTVDYYRTRARANLLIIDKLDFVGETSEFARIFGIEFYHAISRGSQVPALCDF